jgi:hypothetical protein
MTSPIATDKALRALPRAFALHTSHIRVSVGFAPSLASRRQIIQLTMGSPDLEDPKHDARIIASASIEEIGEGAKAATQKEHDMSFGEVIALYPKAAGWSIFFSLGVIMTAFDPQLLGNLYATPAFQKEFGYLYKGSYIISASWQTGLSMGSPIGQVVGALFAVRRDLSTIRSLPSTDIRRATRWNGMDARRPSAPV